MEYQTIISQSGTKHLVNPAPYKPVALRIQSLCGFSIDPDASASESTKECAFCAREAEVIRKREGK